MKNKLTIQKVRDILTGKELIETVQVYEVLTWLLREYDKLAQDVNLWQKRVDEAANIVDNLECKLGNMKKQLVHERLRRGITVDGYKPKGIK